MADQEVGEPQEEPEFYNLLEIILKYGLPQIPEDKQAEVLRVLEEQDLSQIELMGRDETDIMFRVSDQVFHVPILWLTKPVAPEGPGQN